MKKVIDKKQNSLMVFLGILVLLSFVIICSSAIGKINVSQGSVNNENNNGQDGSGGGIESSKSESNSLFNPLYFSPLKQPSNPSKLFDIKLELASSVINNAKELSAVTTFASFGNVPTPVDLTYSILDLSGKEVYSEKGNVTVTTEQIVRKNFESLNLPAGKYTLVLTTVYGDNVKDEFRQVFEVGKAGILHLQSIKNNWILFTIIGGGVIALVIIFVIIYKRKIKSKRGY